MSYKERYQKLIDEYTRLQEELLEVQKEYNDTKEKLRDTLLDKTSIEDDIDDLEYTKEDMIKSKKEKLTNMFGYISTSTITLTSFVGAALSLYFINTNENISIANLFQTILSLLIVEITISTIAEIIIIKKTIKKTKNSDEYKKILIEIKEKEKELLRLKEVIPALEKEFTCVETNLNLLNNRLGEIKGELNTLKEEVFLNALGIAETIEENKPYTKVRTKDSKKEE